MEIINYNVNLNQNVCHKLNNKIASVPKNITNELVIIKEALNTNEKFSIEELNEELNRVRSNTKKRVLTPNNNLNSSGYALFGTVLLLGIVVMILIVILGINSIIG